MKLDIAARRADFRALHQEGYFLLPTARDARAAKHLEALGFAGVASSNASLARALGHRSGQVTRDEALAHVRSLVDATEIAVNADFGSGFADDPLELIENVRLAIATGVAALSIRDAASNELFALENAVDRFRGARAAIVETGADVLLVARCEGLAAGQLDIDGVIERLMAYSAAGADVLCAPGLRDPAAITTVLAAVAPKPLDVELTGPSMRAVELGRRGVRRISVGEAFAEGTWAGFEKAAQHFIDFGDLSPGFRAA